MIIFWPLGTDLLVNKIIRVSGWSQEDDGGEPGNARRTFRSKFYNNNFLQCPIRNLYIIIALFFLIIKMMWTNFGCWFFSFIYSLVATFFDRLSCFSYTIRTWKNCFIILLPIMILNVIVHGQNVLLRRRGHCLKYSVFYELIGLKNMQKQQYLMMTRQPWYTEK